MNGELSSLIYSGLTGVLLSGCAGFITEQDIIDVQRQMKEYRQEIRATQPPKLDNLRDYRQTQEIQRDYMNYLR